MKKKLIGRPWNDNDYLFDCTYGKVERQENYTEDRYLWQLGGRNSQGEQALHL